ncbi:unnamed protein product [Camellia sinensis]
MSSGSSSSSSSSSSSYNFQDQLVFHVTPIEALSKKRGPAGEFSGDGVRYHQPNHQHFGAVQRMIAGFAQGGTLGGGGEGIAKPIMEEIKKGVLAEVRFREMRSGECYFSAMEVLAKHDEKYMPVEVATVVETNKKKIEAAAVDEKAKS